MVPALSDGQLANHNAHVADCECVAAGGVCELCAGGIDPVGRDGAVGAMRVALFQWVVARLGECEDAYGVAGSGDRDFAVCAADDCGV